MEEFKRMILKVSDVQGAVATIPSTSDHTDGSWLVTDIYKGELFLNITDNILQTRTDSGIVTLNNAGSDVNWGDILGTLSDQTDLQNALDEKINYSDYTPSHSLLVQQSGTGSPTSLSVGNNTLVGRLSGGGSEITDLSIAEVKELLNFGTGTTNYISKWIDSDTIGNSQIFDNGTNVGIGISNPNRDFHLHKDTLPDIHITNTASGAGAGDGATLTLDSLDFLINNRESGNLRLFTSGAEKMRITSAGNVGIGTTNPNEALDVVGKISLNDGGNSVFVGENAGLSDDGSNNLNVGIGFNSLRDNTTGINNSAVGYDSLRLNTTGSNNSAVGRNSLFSNTTGYENSAVGLSSLYSNTTGYENSAVGRSSLRSNTSGNSNSALGRESLSSNTTGNSNSAVGVNSLFSNTTGNSNSAVGVNSGRYISDGTTGNSITNNSVYIGTNTKALANNQTNQIVIGYDATGAGSNTATLGNDSITKTILRGNVSTNGSVQVGDNTDAASSANVGAMRYRTDGSASYADMCMETSSGVYAWVNIVTNTF